MLCKQIQTGTQSLNLLKLSYSSYLLTHHLYHFTMPFISSSDIKEFIDLLEFEPLSNIPGLKTQYDLESYVQKLSQNQNDLATFNWHVRPMLLSKCLICSGFSCLAHTELWFCILRKIFWCLCTWPGCHNSWNHYIPSTSLLCCSCLWRRHCCDQTPIKANKKAE